MTCDIIVGRIFYLSMLEEFTIMKTPKNRSLQTICLLCFLFVSFLTPFSATATETVTLQLKWKHQFQFAGYYAAIDKGYYADAGLHVVVKDAGPLLNVIDEVMAGRADYGVGMPGLLIDHQQGKPVVVLADIFQHSAEVLFVLKKSGIVCPQSLVGRRIMMGSDSTFYTKGSFAVQNMLLSEGVSPTKYTLVPQTWDINYLINGKVDAQLDYMTDMPFILKQRGVDYSIINPLSYGVDFYGDNLFTSQEEIKNNPERVQKFLSASLKGWQYAMNHHEEMVDLILKQYNTPLSGEALLYEANAMQKLIQPDFVEIGHINLNRWKRIADNLVKINMLSPDYSLDGFLYAPDEKAKYKKYIHIIWGVVSVLIFMAIAGTIVLLFNRKLNIKVAQKTRELAKEKLFIETIIETIPGTFYVFEEGNRLVRWNKNFLSLSGMSEEELVTMKPLDWFRGKEKETAAKALQRLFETGEVMLEVASMTKDGETPQLLAAKLITIDGKQYMVGLSIDISERISLEQQLRQAQKMESIGRLAGGVAHDFNNVLSIILGYSDLLLGDMSRNNPNRETIKIIQDAGNKAATLTRQLLAFSRKQVLKKKVISINTVIQNFLQILGKMIGDDIIFTTHLTEDSCTIEADPGQIEQILMNMVVNARDAMPDGGEIILETAEIQIDKLYTDKHLDIEPGLYCLLIISDSGEGMDEEVLAKIFDPFFTTKELGRGTGLGLATVYGIVKQHDGYIYVYSEKNKGTTFKIYFPASNNTAEQKESASTTKELLQGDETIMIVDDNTSICHLIVETLKPLGYNCLQAASGKDAIDALRKYSGDVHLLLTDVVMPGMSGRELAETIGKERPEIKVIFMSGYTEDIIAHHGVLETGINYIAKPIVLSKLTSKIRSVLIM